MNSSASGEPDAGVGVGVGDRLGAAASDDSFDAGVGSHALAGQRWPGIPDRPLVLVPLGSTEQHGPHLPFETDSVIATAVAGAVANELGAVVAPTVSYGASGEHQDFPGTASIGHTALEVLVLELVRSLAHWSGRIVLVNGHGGNVPTLASVVPRLVGERHDLAWVPCGVPGGDAHAGRVETSIMLHLSPELVDEAAAVPGATAPIAELLPRLAAEGVRAVSPSGVLGDPTGSSAAEGATMLAAMVASATRRITRADRDDHGCLRDPGPVRDRPPGSVAAPEPQPPPQPQPQPQPMLAPAPAHDPGRKSTSAPGHDGAPAAALGTVGDLDT